MSLLCFSCGYTSDRDYVASPALARMRDWQEKMANFWGQYEYLFHFLRTSLLWFGLAILCAYFDQTREYTAIFVLLAVLVAVSREYIPLAPTPFNVVNSVTSRSDPYSTAARMIGITLVAIVFVGVFVVLAEQTGNVAYHRQTNFKSSSPSYWGVEALPWLTVILIAVPLLYFMSLIVSTRFVSPYLTKL